MSCYHTNNPFAQGLFTVLGALLAIMGGFGAQLFKKYLDHRDDQEMLFHRVNELLLRYAAFSRPFEMLGAENDAARLKREYEQICILDEISKLAPKLKGKKLRSLALRLTRFSLDKEHRGDKELYDLTRQIQLKLNEPLIKDYERGGKASGP